MRIVPGMTGSGAARLRVSTVARSKRGNPEDFTKVTSSTLPSRAMRNCTSAVPSIPHRRARGGYRLALSIFSRRSRNQSIPPRPNPLRLPGTNPVPTPLPSPPETNPESPFVLSPDPRPIPPPPFDPRDRRVISPDPSPSPNGSSEADVLSLSGGSGGIHFGLACDRGESPGTTEDLFSTFPSCSFAARLGGEISAMGTKSRRGGGSVMLSSSRPSEGRALSFKDGFDVTKPPCPAPPRERRPSSPEPGA